MFIECNSFKGKRRAAVFTPDAGSGHFVLTSLPELGAEQTVLSKVLLLIKPCDIVFINKDEQGHSMNMIL